MHIDNYSKPVLPDHPIRYVEEHNVRIATLMLMMEPFMGLVRLVIVVISARAGNRKVYPGSSKYENKIFLYHSGIPGKGHFDTIVKVNALLCKQYYCDKCDKGLKNRTGHKCQVWCNVCGRENCEKKTDWKICSDCNKEVRISGVFHCS